MKITRLELVNFKRFTHLTLEGIPAGARLVLLIGANGSGKSSVFDAFECLKTLPERVWEKMPALPEESFLYYAKDAKSFFQIQMNTLDGHYMVMANPIRGKPEGGITIGNTENFDLNPANLYGRTSFRQVPRLTRTALGQFNEASIESDEDRPRQYILRDERFENDIEDVINRIIEDVFRKTDANERVQAVRARYIEPINQAFERIFGNENGTQLRLLEIIPPTKGETARLTFTKGKAEISYNYLGAGEKEIFNILLNLLVRRGYFNDTIYFFDELDLHLNTSIQINFLKELTENWLPDNSQLWTASHSLGFIEYARQSEHAVILDFDNFDFDYPQTIAPESKERLDVFEIAVPKAILSELLRGKRLVMCENKNDEYYNLLNIPDTIFVGVKDARDVFLNVKRDDRYLSIRDRDFLSDTEISKIQQRYPKHRILKYYDFENYVYHPDNIAEIRPDGFDRETYITEITRQKNERIYSILAVLDSSRKNYEEFKTDESLRDKNFDGIIEDFKSDEFERFYKYFDMKDQFSKTYLQPFNLSKKELVSTNWFKRQMREVLGL